MEIHMGKRKLGLFRLFIFFLNLKMLSMVAMAKKEKTNVKVGVVLDIMDDNFGKMGMSCISMALSDFYVSHTHYKTRVILNTIDSNGTVVDAAAAAVELIKKVEVQAIIGPGSSMQANFMIEIGDKSHVPTISFSATRPSLTSHRSSFFFRVAQNDSSQVKAIGAIVKAFRWRQVVPIYVDNEFGEGIIPYLIDALQEVDAKVPYQCLISPKATDDQIVAELHKLMTMQTRVFVVHMLPDLASRIFTKAKEIGMMTKGYVWVMTDGITNGLGVIKPSVWESMQGVIGIKTYVPRSQKLEYFKLGWMRRFQMHYPTIVDIPQLNVFGLWAYDAAWAIAMAVENAGTENLKYDTTNITVINLNSSNYLYTIGVNRNGPKLRDALSNITFKGLAGKFSLINGQLQSSFFQIVNVIGNGGRNIGFWSLETGLTKKLLNSSKAMANLRPIIWPGDSTSVPKGWEIPTNEKRLRIMVPVKEGFFEFVNVVFDPNTKTNHVSGYCIDVFKAVIEALPYAVAYELIPFDKTNGQHGGTYNDLIYQVYLGNVDAVVGDTTILANRSSYIDYTLPFTESGVSMVVPVRETRKNTNGLAFFKPLALNLWLTTLIFFFFMALVVWILEHRLNDDFHGTACDQICTSLWYSFSTMVFAQREPALNHWTKFVVIIWLFVVFIITQSYTASLASLLTLQELKPTATDINQLLVNGENIGYQKGSFVYGILKSLKFDDSKLITYGSAEEMDQLFTKGSLNGGISAAVDEFPYIRLFMAKYCKKYTTVEPNYKADGFGFVFPMGSPLVPEISRAILKVAEGERMKEIENAWFKKVTKCSGSDNVELSSTRLSINSFRGLFYITGSVSLFCCISYIIIFLWKERGLLLNPNTTIRRRFRDLVSRFLQRDARPHPDPALRRRMAINALRARVHPEGIIITL